jgi:cbb3-type cytochrome oxidase subunit 3
MDIISGIIILLMILLFFLIFIWIYYPSNKLKYNKYSNIPILEKDFSGDHRE